MLPLTLLASQKLSDLLTTNSALAQAVESMALSGQTVVPVVSAKQIILSSAGAEIADRDVELTYPRVCLYTSGFKASQLEKFRSLSGTLSTVAEIWMSGNLVSDTDRWIHFYVEAVSSLLRANIGDWGDGVFFFGAYDVQFQPPKAGGLGFVQMARIRCDITVSRN